MILYSFLGDEALGLGASIRIIGFKIDIKIWEDG